MALGIATSLYLLGKLRDSAAFAPRVDFVDYEDGLLSVRSKRALTSTDNLIRLRASFGTVIAEVKVESYEAGTDLYRLSLLDHQILPESLDRDQREQTRLVRRLQASSLAVPGELFTEDISPGGVRLTTPQLLTVGQMLDFQVQLGDLVLETEAQVRWSAQKLDQTYHAGLRFEGMSAAQTYNVTCFIEDHLMLEQKLKTLDSHPRAQKSGECSVNRKG